MVGITGSVFHDGSHDAVGYNYKNFTNTTTGTVINAQPGILHTITLNTPASTAVITLYDNAAGASGSAIIGTFTVSASQPAVTLTYDVMYASGLSIKIATAACDVTVSYI